MPGRDSEMTNLSCAVNERFTMVLLNDAIEGQMKLKLK